MCFYVKSNDWNENFFKSLFLSKINLQGKWFMHFSCNSHTSLAHCSVCLYLGLSESGTRWRPRQSGRQPPENFIGKKNQWLCPSSSGAGGKESACQSRRCKRWEFDPWACNILWRRKWKPTPIFIPGKPHGQRSPAGSQSTGSQRIGHDWAPIKYQRSMRTKLEEKGFSLWKLWEESRGLPWWSSG